MYLFIATDTRRRAKNLWLVGFSKRGIDGIKEELRLNRVSSSVDLVSNTPCAKEILSLFKAQVTHERVDNETVLVEGEHAKIAEILLSLTKKYELEHPSFRRTLTSWLLNVSY